MEEPLSKDVLMIQENKKIQKMFDVYNKVINAIVIFFIAQFVLWCTIIWIRDLKNETHRSIGGYSQWTLPKLLHLSQDVLSIKAVNPIVTIK